MKRDWIKLDAGILNDPKYGTLTDDLWKLMIQLNLVACEADRDGLLPAVRDMAWILRMGSGELTIAMYNLSKSGLVHSTPQGWVVTGFKESQAASNSTERNRAFRKRRRSATQDEDESNEEATQKITYGATEMQLSRHIPVSKPVPAPDRDPAQRGRPGKSRRRRKAKGQPVEKTEDPLPQDRCPQDPYPVDKPVEKGWKNSVPTHGSTSTSSNSSLIKNLKPTSTSSSLIKNLKPTTSTSSRLINYLKPSLNLKLLVLVDQADLKIETEKFRPLHGKILENRLNAPGSTPSAPARQVPPGRSGQATVQSGVTSHNLREPVDTCPVDKPVDTCPVNGFSQEKGRKISNPEDIPP